MSRKLEEKQQRRLAEERKRQEQHRAARRRNLLTFGIMGLVAALVVVLIVVERRGSEGPVGVAAEQAGCTEIERPEELGREHVADGTPVQYSSSPPTSGPHYDRAGDAGFYGPDAVGTTPPERFVHNLEHGQIVIWYRPNAPQGVIDNIDDYISKQSGNQALALVAVPYEDLDDRYTLALTAWGAMQSCAEVSEDVIGAFREQFQGRGPEQVGIPTYEG